MSAGGLAALDETLAKTRGGMHERHGLEGTALLYPRSSFHTPLKLLYSRWLGSMLSIGLCSLEASQ
jgi:hypothetical protein